tara:strand:- start:1640 stop:2665 length:1026 start_codon:yes stop_codon:yes gene_type:complete
MRSKVFFINGGAGRVIASIPALEKYAETHDDFVIVAEGGMNFFKGHPVLDKYAYDHWHKNLFEDKIKHRDCMTPEPYRRWHYYNQKCNIAQAYDMEINGLDEPRDLPTPKIKLSKTEAINAINLVEQIKAKTKKDKVIVVQPFGRGAEVQGEFIIDQSSRSFHQRDIVEVINNLRKDYGVIIMSEFQFVVDPPESNMIPCAWPQADIRVWAGIIECADHFLGCDSVGQHIAKSVNTTVTTVIGATFPVNISYPEDRNFDIIDIGEGKRVFQPLRLTAEDYQDMMNDECMKMTSENVQSVITSCRKRLGKSKAYSGNLKLEEEQQPNKCCDNTPQLNRGFGK